MIIFTMGFTKKTAMEFFNLIKSNEIELVIDVRLNNKTQLAGFTKGEDLSFFLHEICKCKYMHSIEFAPTKEILDSYKKGLITWDEYEEEYVNLMKNRKNYYYFHEMFSDYKRVCLLCSETTAENCHRRLLADLIIETAPATTKVLHI